MVSKFFGGSSKVGRKTEPFLSLSSYATSGIEAEEKKKLLTI
jgi:hypothetical protein